jgi:hypothetical protein
MQTGGAGQSAEEAGGGAKKQIWDHMDALITPKEPRPQQPQRGGRGIEEVSSEDMTGAFPDYKRKTH